MSLHYRVRSSSSSSVLNASGHKITGKPPVVRGRANTTLLEGLGVAASLKLRTAKAKKAKARKEQEKDEEEAFFKALHKDDDMASSFLQYCTMCDSEIRVPDNTVLYCSESCRRRDSLPTTPSTGTHPSHTLQFNNKRPELNRILSIYHTGKSDPDPTEWKPSDPSDVSEWKPPKSGSGHGKPSRNEKNKHRAEERLSKSTGDHWKPKLSDRGGSDAYKYLSGFHKETPKLGSTRSSANASRTSLSNLLDNSVNNKDSTKVTTGGGGAAAEQVGNYKDGPATVEQTDTTTRSAPSLSHTPTTSTDDEDSSLASTPASGSPTTRFARRGITASVAVSSTSGSNSSSPGKDLYMAPTTTSLATAKGMKTAVEPPTPLKVERPAGLRPMPPGGITKLYAANRGDVAG